jgi:hypothetical protein
MLCVIGAKNEIEKLKSIWILELFGAVHKGRRSQRMSKSLYRRKEDKPRKTSTRWGGGGGPLHTNTARRRQCIAPFRTDTLDTTSRQLENS